MSGLNLEQVRSALSGIMDPDLEQDIISLGFVKSLDLDNGKIQVHLELPSLKRDAVKTMTQAIEQSLKTMGAAKVKIKSRARVTAAPSGAKAAQKGIANMIAVASGKGGVGKSTVSINLALALAASGARVGLLDCDLYGPSLPAMVGIHERIQTTRKQQFLPHEVYGLKIMSMGFLTERSQPVAWRGPMLHKALTQFVQQTHWGDLDYLILDLPPGTGDIQLTLAQSVPVVGAVLVTTPQEVALRDVKKGLQMFQRMKVPVLGLVENMSYYLCGHCEKHHHLFGEGGGERMSKAHNLPLLAKIPLDATIPGQVKLGEPLFVREPQSAAAKAFRQAAGGTLAALSSLGERGPDPVQPGPGWAKPGQGAMEV